VLAQLVELGDDVAAGVQPTVEDQVAAVADRHGERLSARPVREQVTAELVHDLGGRVVVGGVAHDASARIGRASAAARSKCASNLMPMWVPSCSARS
jgi:hypothetical protein